MSSQKSNNGNTNNSDRVPTQAAASAEFFQHLLSLGAQIGPILQAPSNITDNQETNNNNNTNQTNIMTRIMNSIQPPPQPPTTTQPHVQSTIPPSSTRTAHQPYHNSNSQQPPPSQRTESWMNILDRVLNRDLSNNNIGGEFSTEQINNTAAGASVAAAAAAAVDVVNMHTVDVKTTSTTATMTTPLGSDRKDGDNDLVLPYDSKRLYVLKATVDGREFTVFESVLRKIPNLWRYVTGSEQKFTGSEQKFIVNCTGEDLQRILWYVQCQFMPLHNLKLMEKAQLKMMAQKVGLSELVRDMDWYLHPKPDPEEVKKLEAGVHMLCSGLRMPWVHEVLNSFQPYRTFLDWMLYRSQQSGRNLESELTHLILEFVNTQEWIHHIRGQYPPTFCATLQPSSDPPHLKTITDALLDYIKSWAMFYFRRMAQEVAQNVFAAFTHNHHNHIHHNHHHNHTQIPIVQPNPPSSQHTPGQPVYPSHPLNFLPEGVPTQTQQTQQIQPQPQPQPSQTQTQPSQPQQP
jgi:hypothetical protein